MLLLVTSRLHRIYFETLGQTRLGWLYTDDMGLRMGVVVTVVAIMTQVLDFDDIVVAMMGSTI